MRRGGWANRPLFWGSLGLGSLIVACGGHTHSCFETRTCVAPIGFIDAGNVDDWWDAGAGGGDTSSAEGAAAGAGGSNEAGATATPSSPPQITALSPSDHAIGVSNDAAIQITFDRAMNEDSVLAAYSSDDLPLSALSVSWTAAGTVLALEPKTALTFARSYRFGFDERARDSAGNALAAASFSFSTLRQVVTQLAADPARTGNWTDGEGEGVHNCLRTPPLGYVPSVCIGDDSSNVRYTGFISFDLGALPADVRGFSSARLVASGSVNGTIRALGASSLEHVAFGELGAAALSAPADASLGSFFGNTDVRSGSDVELSVDVTAAVARDYAAPQFSQYRLKFAGVSANGIWDDLELTTSEVRLSLVYLVP